MSDPVEKSQIRTVAASVDSKAKAGTVEGLGCGAFGNVYGVNELVVKVPKVKASNPTGSVEAGDLLCHRLQNEGLPTDGIVKIETIRNNSTGHYVVMERCRGGELRNMEGETGAKLLAEGGALDLMNSLNELHRRDCAHRDIKPANIFCTAKKGGGAKIGDFGFLTECGDGFRSFNAGGVYGTPRYFPPEKLVVKGFVSYDRSLLGDMLFNEKRADCWALGATFFEVLTGKSFIDFVCKLCDEKFKDCDFRVAMAKLFLDQDGFQKYFKDAVLAELQGVKVRPLMRAMVGELLNPDPELALGIGEILDVIEDVGKRVEEYREEYELMQETKRRRVAEEIGREKREMEEKRKREEEKKIEREKKEKKEREKIERERRPVENSRRKEEIEAKKIDDRKKKEDEKQRREIGIKKINDDKKKEEDEKRRKEAEKVRKVKENKDMIDAEKKRREEERRKESEERTKRIKEEGSKEKGEGMGWRKALAVESGGGSPVVDNHNAALGRIKGAEIFPQGKKKHV
ncbi:MAG: protein kinase, partial [Rickettsiales bacterium]|nr:protein kinase [Rickettsiales bacterium]